ncbi:hypothetical protein HAX54_032063 [Datura stramonium]|uniref:Uncharacterized protein n=1 Tax=Datura stramonium TaxID=4076 RepID=A0ABS8VDQ9_DATST|nr:hypothetical protein [Datura stramonium]
MRLTLFHLQSLQHWPDNSLFLSQYLEHLSADVVDLCLGHLFSLCTLDCLSTILGNLRVGNIFRRHARVSYSVNIPHYSFSLHLDCGKCILFAPEHRCSLRSLFPRASPFTHFSCTSFEYTLFKDDKESYASRSDLTVPYVVRCGFSSSSLGLQNHSQIACVLSARAC